MKFLILNLTIALLLAGTSLVCSAVSFEERVVIAKKIEDQKEASDYFFGSFFPTIGPNIAGIMHMCLSHQDANSDKFSLVANISSNGDIIDVDFEPKSNNTAACFANQIVLVKAPAPPLCDNGPLPVVLDMAVKP